MSSAERAPDEVLAELGRRLDNAYAAAERRPGFARVAGRRAPRWAVALAAALLIAVPGAVATHDTLFTQPPPVPPELLGGPGSVTPTAAGVPVYVRSGSSEGVSWRLSAAVCRYGAVQAVGLFLEVPGGGAGARCDIASRLRGARVSPQDLAERRVQSYVDPVADRTWVFGVLPLTAATVDVASRDLASGPGVPLEKTAVSAVPIDADAARRGVPAGLRVFVVALPHARDVPAVEVSDSSGALILRCGRAGRCLEASPNQESHR